jgi:endonuclease/exonuclease/phosphatase family metal-dependent hydrolase
LTINGFVALLLVLSAYSANIDPVDTTLMAFLGLAFPFILLANVIFLVFWIAVKRKFILFSLIAMIVSYNAVSNFIQFNLSSKAPEEAIKVMSYNVRLFDLYNWSKNIDSRNKIFDQLAGQNADIYCFQEFYYTSQKGKFETRDTLVTFLNAKNYREAYTHEMRGGQFFGLATFTKYPIINSGKINFQNDDNNICLYIDVQLNDDTVRIYNMHIASIRFSYDDYTFVENIDSKSESKELEEGARNIYHRLSNAFVKRSEQSKVITAHIEACPYPAIVCGDFNDSPNSFCYAQFSSILTDSFKEAGNGIGKTYIGAFPSFRIDYIFHSDEFEAKDYHTLPEKYSDHHAIVSDIIMK